MELLLIMRIALVTLGIGTRGNIVRSFLIIPISEHWLQMYSQLLLFYKEHGHCKV